MKIEGIKAYQVDLPVAGGRFTLAKQRSATTLDCTVVEITTDSGFTGYGEVLLYISIYLTRETT